LIAVSSESALYTAAPSHLLSELQSRLDAFLPGSSLARKVTARLSRTVTVCPEEWGAPAGFSSPENILCGETWNAVCRYISGRYGNFRYDPRRSRSIHLILPDGEAALFQLTVCV
jgi:hypothetical protein